MIWTNLVDDMVWFRRKQKEKSKPGPETEPQAEAVIDSELEFSSPEEALPVDFPEAEALEAAPESAPEEPETAAAEVAPEPVSAEPESIPASEAEPKKGLFRRFLKRRDRSGDAAAGSEPESAGLEETAPPEAPEALGPEAAPESAPGEAPQPEPEAPEPAPEEPEALPAAEEEPRKGIFRRFKERLDRSRDAIAGGLDRLFAGKKVVDASLLDDLEEVLITADLGVETTLHLVQGLHERLKRRELGDVARLKAALSEEMLAILEAPAIPEVTARPRVVLMVGVNGVGKTTTLAKLAHQEKLAGRNPLLIAADTFRAAAVEQLEIWGERLDAPVIKQKTGADPAAVVFDGLAAALARDVDTVFIDTAGRLHTKVNLMEELKKIYRTTAKKLPGAPHEVLLVLDATTGQNALSQVRLFHEAVNVTGIVLTKMDGTAKGGVALAVVHETGLPIRYIGLGEGLEDLRPFDAGAFVAAILGEEEG